MTKDKELNKVLRESFGEEGTIRFSIKANNTSTNEAIHEEFKNFCEIECDNNYTMGLKLLLDYKKDDYKFELLYETIKKLNIEIEELKSKLNKPVTDEKEVF